MLISGLIPTGVITPYGGSSAPDGWLGCDGSAVSRTTYSDLYGIVGTSYGVGDGATTFNLPNMQDNVAIGAGNSYSVGDTGGEATHTLTTSEMPSHTHTQDAHTHTQDSHNHSVNPPSDTTDSDSHRHRTWGDSGGGGAPYGTDGSSGNDGSAGGTDSDNTRYWSSQDSHQHTFNISSFTSGSETASNQNATATNQTTGSGSAHNNLPPYVGCTYIIKT